MVARLRLTSVAVVLGVAVLGHATVALGQASVTVSDDGRRTVRRLPVNLLRGAAGVFSPDSLRPIVIGSAATGLSTTVDDEIAEAIADPDHSFGTSFESGASPTAVGAALVVAFGAGRLSDRPRVRALTYDWMDAFLVNAGYTTLLKEVVKRERPNGEDQKSFPSGHASNAFALAAVAERHYGWKVGVPAYGLAGAVAVSRLQRNKHYLSDVVAGSTVGYLVGRAVVRVNGQLLSSSRARQFGVAPVITRQSRALVADVTF
jgi:membrane-associated phospholipid phosphatase